MSTHRRTWQKAEGRAADLFGPRRQVGSGSCGRPDASKSDSTHGTLFLECKLRAKDATRSLFDEVRAKAKAEDKTAVLCLFAKGKPGCLVVLHSGDLDAVLDARREARDRLAEVEAWAYGEPGTPRS